MASKVKTIYYCSNCGASSPKWAGKCSTCQEWNTYQEEIVEKKTKSDQLKDSSLSHRNRVKPIVLSKVEKLNTATIRLPGNELNRVLGGGLVHGSVILVGGSPGIGKSTLLLQTVLRGREKVMYVSGEESPHQVRMRASRISTNLENCFLLSETNVHHIVEEAKELKPSYIVIDSIQTLVTNEIESAPGSVSQVRECTHALQQFAKEYNVPIFIIGHINKEGSIAGPKVLEHVVDVVLQFEGDRNYSYRLLRGIKNRFGSTDEMGIYEMTEGGLREVSNPSELLLSQSEEHLSGSTIASTIEGMRPIMLETQALVSPAIYGTPQRSATGFDLRRLSMLLAVLEKRAGIMFGNQDVFLNMAGGIKVTDPAIDLSILAALVSSLNNIPVQNKCAFSGEVGLTGEIRAVSRIIQRIQEAERLGFEKIFLSKYNFKGLDKKDFDIELIEVNKVQDLIEILFA